jgi:hypothetical protein
VTCESFAGGVLGISEDDRIFSTTKLYHAYGLGNALSFPLHFGRHRRPARRPAEPERLLATLRDQRPDGLLLGSRALHRAGRAPGRRCALDSVRLCVSAAEPLPPATFDRWRERFGLEIVDGIGSTEMLHIYCSNRPGEVVRGTTGRPVPGYELRLVDDDGEVLDGAAVGNLEVRGDSCAAFYWHQHEKTKRCMRGDWFASGDRFERHADGTYAYVGRSDDMLKIGGLWVSPIDMENVLIEHPAVAGLGVVGTTVDGQSRIAAFIELADGVRGDEQLADELRAWCKERMRRYEYPHVVRFVDALPRTLTGKVQRFKLRELARGGNGRDPARRRSSGPDRPASTPTDQLLKAGFEVDLYDALPTPFGLVRAGVAPRPPQDQVRHACLREDGCPRGLPLLRRRRARDPHHARGSSRALPRDPLRGRHRDRQPARHSRRRTRRLARRHRVRRLVQRPSRLRGRRFDLTAERAVVIGNGNVALDVARMLVLHTDELAPTDTADHALDALAAARVQEVAVLGRRGPAQAAFTNPELLELGELSRADVVVDPADLEGIQPPRLTRPSAATSRSCASMPAARRAVSRIASRCVSCVRPWRSSATRRVVCGASVWCATSSMPTAAPSRPATRKSSSAGSCCARSAIAASRSTASRSTSAGA